MDFCAYCRNVVDDIYDREETKIGPMHESCFIDYRYDLILDDRDDGYEG